MFLRIASIALHVFLRACNYPEKWSSNQQGTTSCKSKSTLAPADASTTGSAYGQSHTPEYLAAAQNVHRFVRPFLTSPDGAFYVSQDADVSPGDTAHPSSLLATKSAAPLVFPASTNISMHARTAG
jgi:hypothetical protein